MTFQGLAHPILLRDADAVADDLARIAPTWPHRLEPLHGASGRPARQPHTRIEARNGRYRYVPWWGRPELDRLAVTSAACGAVADLSQAYLDEHPGYLGLHCGAFSLNGRVVALTGPYCTGKSTLIARLTAEPGFTVFCDDVLPVTQDGRALALGFGPRLRLPLPDQATPAFRDHVARHTGPSDTRYAYVMAPSLAPHGAEAPLAAIVVLSRIEGATARLHHLDVTEAVRQVIRQNIADPGAPMAHIERVTRMAQGLACLRMVYWDIEEATALLRRAFGGATVPAEGVAVHPALPEATEPHKDSARDTPADLAAVYQRDPEIGVRQVASDLFLWHPARRAFFALNPVAHAVWNLMETPVAGTELCALLEDVFPDTPPDRIASDIGLLLGRLQREDLIWQVSGSRCEPEERHAKY